MTLWVAIASVRSYHIRYSTPALRAGHSIDEGQRTRRREDGMLMFRGSRKTSPIPIKIGMLLSRPAAAFSRSASAAILICCVGRPIAAATTAGVFPGMPWLTKPL
jgi:hypothetical protein